MIHLYVSILHLSYLTSTFLYETCHALLCISSAFYVYSTTQQLLFYLSNKWKKKLIGHVFYAVFEKGKKSWRPLINFMNLRVIYKKTVTIIFFISINISFKQSIRNQTYPTLSCVKKAI